MLLFNDSGSHISGDPDRHHRSIRICSKDETTTGQDIIEDRDKIEEEADDEAGDDLDDDDDVVGEL